MAIEELRELGMHAAMHEVDQRIASDEREYEQEVELWPQEERRTRTRETERGEPGSFELRRDVCEVVVHAECA